MAPSRSRKRNSTVQALDLLNNVGNANQNQPTPRSRVQQQPRRQLRAEVQIPKSDHIWDIPSSPEKQPDTRRRIADNEPITPRRSARYRSQVEQDKEDNASSSGNKWLRPRAVVDYTKGTQGIEEGNDKDGGEEGEEEDSGGEEGELRLFSEDDTPKTTRSNRRSLQKPSDKDEFPDLPSPSALFRGEGFIVSSSASEHSDGESEESDSGEEVPNAPRTTRKPDTNKTQNEEESGSSEEASVKEESSESGDESSSRVASRPPPPRPRPIVQINQTQRESRNPPATQTRKTPTQPQANKASGQKKDAWANSKVGEDSSSSYETDDGESDSSSSSEEPAGLAPDEDDPPVSRQSKRRRVEPEPSTRRQSLRNQNAAPSLGDQEVGDTRGQSPESDGEEDDDSDEEEEEEEEEEEDEAAKEAEKAKRFQWMEEAMSLGQQRNNWLVVTSEARELKRMADPALAKYFVDVCTTIRELRQLYADMLDTPPSNTDLARCNNLLANIPREGDEPLDQAYYMATRDSNFCEGEEHARDLVAEFEARVIPAMVKLLFACFQVYYTNPVMFPGLHGHFRRVLTLLLRFGDRTASMKMQRIVRGVVRTKGLRRALHELLKGLDSRALRPKRASARISGAGNQHEDIVSVNGHEREWSEDEGLALIDGLQAYQGPDRYLHIIEHLGHRLRHRTQRELRAKALEVHDRMQPTIAAQLETEEGRGRWGWLLSVRGSYRLH